MQTINVQAVEADDLEHLEQLEAEVEAGLELVYQGGAKMQRAIAAIQDERLWARVQDNSGNQVYQSFEHYCEVRWQAAKQALNNHAIAGRVANEMLSTGIPEADIPQRTSQLRALGEVEPESRAEVLKTAKTQGGGKTTAIGIKMAAQKLAKPEVGQTYEVVNPDNLHAGKVVEVSEVKSGGIALAQETGDFPFLPGELQPTEPIQPEPKPIKLSLRERCGLYQVLLERVLGLTMPGELKAEIQAALTQP